MLYVIIFLDNKYPPGKFGNTCACILSTFYKVKKCTLHVCVSVYRTHFFTDLTNEDVFLSLQGIKSKTHFGFLSARLIYFTKCSKNFSKSFTMHQTGKS